MEPFKAQDPGQGSCVPEFQGGTRTSVLFTLSNSSHMLVLVKQAEGVHITKNCGWPPREGQQETGPWGTWVAQLVKHPTLAQVMISWFVNSSPTSDSVLTARSLEPALDSVCVSFSLSIPLPLPFSLCLSKINKC